MSILSASRCLYSSSTWQATSGRIATSAACFTNKGEKESQSQTTHNLGLWKEKTEGEELKGQTAPPLQQNMVPEVVSTMPSELAFKKFLPPASCPGTQTSFALPLLPTCLPLPSPLLRLRPRSSHSPSQGKLSRVPTLKASCCPYKRLSLCHR